MGPEAKASRFGYREQAKSEVSIQRSDGKCRLDPFRRDSRLVNRTDGPVPRPRDLYHTPFGAPVLGARAPSRSPKVSPEGASPIRLRSSV